MSRMFVYNGKPMLTWNVFVGCNFECSYCSARKAALSRFKHVPRYRNGFVPHLIESELGKRFKLGDFYFIGYMGDISFAFRDEVCSILNVVWSHPQVRFLFCSKDPSCYSRWGLDYPSNLYLGATIESNFDHGVSKAPAPFYRYEAMKALEHPHKFVSMEPLMDFHLATVVQWMREIGPEIIEVGPDNYNNNLVEPVSAISKFRAPWKVVWLLEDLRQFCPNVIEKKGLERLKEGGEYVERE